jgi:hypothetical protein
MKLSNLIRQSAAMITVGALAAAMLVGAASADITNRIHYRCWDDTLRVSHGGWVSYRYMAEDNCERAAQVYPNHDLWIESERY